VSGAQGRHRAVAALALLVALAAALVWAAPRPADLPTSSAALGSWLAGASVEDVVATLAGLTAELCLAWLCLGAVLAALGHLPGPVGRVAGSVAGRVAPAVVRRLVEAALGVTVAGASLAGTAVPALAASAGVIRPPAATLGGPATGTVDPATTLGAAWAGATARAGAPGALDTDSGAPALTLAAGTDSAAPALTLDAGTDSVGPAARLPSLDRPIGPPPVLDRPLGTPSSSDGPSAGSDPVLGPVRTTTDGAAVVRRGDSLWSIAARHLPAGATDHEIAAAWPRWYAANRTVIGPDPDLLRPGQRLVPPV